MKPNDSDVRWKQRFANYRRALASLTKFVEHGKLNEFEEQGLVQAFEYTYELAWNTIKDFLEEQGHQNIAGSKDAFRLAFSLGIIDNGDVWMMMLQSRNKTSHTYNEEVVKEIVNGVYDYYYPQLLALEQTLLARV